MSRCVQTIHRDTYVSEVAGIFDVERIGAAPLVSEGGDTVGIITKSDITRFDYVGGDPYTARAWEIANPEPSTIEASAPLEQAARMMSEDRIHHLIVVEGDAIVGILSSLDFVTLFAEGAE
jgi:CBS domain-containing protein